MLTITAEPDHHLLLSRWDAPGTESSYLLDDRNAMRSGLRTDCWRWLVDFRLHGDLTVQNAKYFFELVLPDEAQRLYNPATGAGLRVAVVVSPVFSVLPASIPSTAFQQQHQFVAQAFTEEGQARQWLLELGPDPG